LLQQTAAVITAAVTSLEEPLRATMALIGNERPTLVHDSNALSEALARLSEGIEALASQLDGAKATQERQSAQLQRATAAVQYWKNEALELRGGE
jgi:soluble cytochrome b562